MFRYVHWFSFNIHHRQAWKPFGFFFSKFSVKMSSNAFQVMFLFTLSDACWFMSLHAAAYRLYWYCVLCFVVCLFVSYTMSTFGGLLEEIKDISIDRFDGDNVQSKVFFLSHCHTDHMVGLRDHSNGLPGPLYVSPVTAVIVGRLFPCIKDVRCLAIGSELMHHIGMR